MSQNVCDFSYFSQFYSIPVFVSVAMCIFLLVIQNGVLTNGLVCGDVFVCKWIYHVVSLWHFAVSASWNVLVNETRAIMNKYKDTSSSYCEIHYYFVFTYWMCVKLVLNVWVLDFFVFSKMCEDINSLYWFAFLFCSLFILCVAFNLQIKLFFLTSFEW